MFNIVYGIRIICTIGSLLILMLLMREEYKSREHSILQMIMTFLFVFNLDMLFLVKCKTIEAGMVAQQIKSVSIFSIMILMLYFCICFTRENVSRRVHEVVTGICLIFNVILIFITGIPGFFFRTIETTESDSVQHLEVNYGVGGYLFEFVLYLLALMIMSTAILYFRKKATSRNSKNRKRILLVATIIPTTVFTCYFFDIIPYYEINIIGITVSGCILTIAANHYRIFDVVESTKHMVLETLDEGVVIYDESHNLLYANRVGKKLYEKVEAFSAEHSNHMHLSQDGIVRLEGKIYEIHGIPIYHEKRKYGYYYYLLDVTERRKRMEELDQARESAERANQAKSNFLATVSHEIRTPLNGIIGISEIALRTNTKKEMGFQLKSILNSARTLLNIINDILDLSKIEAGQLELAEEEYQVERLIYDVLNMGYMNVGDKPVLLEAEINPEVPGHLIGDYMRIQQILINLLGNAVKYTKEGSIRLVIDGEKRENDYLLKVDVIDTGCGIRPEDTEKIFGMYQQLKSVQNKTVAGTGLGLAITKNMVELMQGSITVESEVGRGSVFHVCIRQGIGTREQILHTKITSDMIREGFCESYLDAKFQYTFPQARILVVDDISTNLVVAKGLLEPYMVSVECVNSADAAVHAVQKKEYQLIFMDHMMPEKDGMEAVKEIRAFEQEKGEHTAIVAMTADVTNGQKDAFLKKGFSDYLSKPINPVKLEKILLRWLPGYKRINYTFQADIRTDNMELLEECGISTTDGITNNGNNIKNYYRVLAAYQRETKAMLPELKRLSKENLNLLCTKVHGIKSSSYAIGAKTVGSVAERIEAEIKEERLGTLEEDLAYLERVITMAGTGIQNFLEKKNQEEILPETENRQPLQEEWFNQMEKALAGYDSILAEKLLENAKERAVEQQQPFLQEMRECMDAYEYAKGKALLKKQREMR